MTLANPGPMTLDATAAEDARIQREDERDDALRTAVSADAEALVDTEPVLSGVRQQLAKNVRAAARRAVVLGALIVSGLACTIVSSQVAYSASTVGAEHHSASLWGAVAGVVAFLSLLVFVANLDSFDQRHFDHGIGKPDEVSAWARAHGVELGWMDSHRVSARLLGGWKGQDGVNVRTDRVHLSLTRTQALLDEWAVEDFMPGDGA